MQFTYRPCVDKMVSPRRVIVDVDVGSDDFLALWMLLKADKKQQVKIEAIICTMGNTSVENVCKNVARLLEITKRTDVITFKNIFFPKWLIFHTIYFQIPVYKGATNQLIPPAQKPDTFHGPDGLGGLEYDTEPDLSIIRKDKTAAQAMRDIVVNQPGQISLICVAPLTNVALATRLYDDFLPNVKDVWIMGGNYTGSKFSKSELN